MAASHITELRILRWRDEGRRDRLIQLGVVAFLVWLSNPSAWTLPWLLLTGAAIWIDAEIAARRRLDLSNERLKRMEAVGRVAAGTLFGACSVLLLMRGSGFGLSAALFLASANTISNAVMNRGSARATTLMLGPSVLILMILPWIALATGSLGSLKDALLMLSGGLLFATFVAQLVSSLAGEARDYEAAVDQARAAAASRDVFLANMSHEIRTPLNGVVGVAHALEQTPLNPSQREMVGLIGGSGRVLERLLSDVLDSAKIEAGAFTLESLAFDLRSEIDAAALLMRDRAAEKGVGFDLAVSPSADGVFVGDAVRLRQIVANLASNAVKFTDAGSVRIQADVIDRDSGPLLILTVSDDGIGFDAEVAGRLFQPFTQADTSITRRFGGSGLGLSISRALAETMGGALSASSTPGVGSTFTLTVPLARGQLEPAAERSLPVEQPEQGLRVLVAEDHPTNQKVVRMFLEPHGIEVVVAENGQIALDLWRAGGFDAVLMDMQMPVMDGVAAVERIRAIEQARGLARTPIAMLTANAMAEHRAAALAAGADGHITKPVTPASLLEGLMTVLSARQEEARLSA
ncbi:ATP-binding protein [Caulobacter sp. NIBR1757]|uniref:ATP-binding protein n=1 Tax=Caulobacter sp. NIBR1757 TaxID=3016000 RepID=UPI0022EFE3BD|nr:ATP-binding protein [Caulobacter sp. NIBR1757]WGM37886.1 Sensor histidine kinase RcsC [Caulobacter sp. NIBR1757]